MSTHAEIEIVNYNGKRYKYWRHADGYPSGVIPMLPDGEVDFEDFRQSLNVEDIYEPMPDYFYEISLPDSLVSIYHADTSTRDWKRGELIFTGTFKEAKEKFSD